MASDGPWADATPIPGISTDSPELALAATTDAIHAVWGCYGELFHAILAGGKWLGPIHFANGEQPSLAAGADGTLHCAFAHWFLGNCEVFYTRWGPQGWSLPQLVSRTSGTSSHPALALTQGAGAHMVWADTTPSTPAIYHAVPQGNAWANGPIPSAPGVLPAVAVSSNGEIFAAWQDRLAGTGRFEILAACYRDGAWSIPELVSDSPQHDSLNPALAAGPRGPCHLAWQEERAGLYHIRHSVRHPGGWAPPEEISRPHDDARLPRIAVTGKEFLHAAWAEGASLKHRARAPGFTASWWTEETAGEAVSGFSDLAVAVSPATGELHAIWSAYGESERRGLYHAYRKPLIQHTVFIPFVAGQS